MEGANAPGSEGEDTSLLTAIHRLLSMQGSSNRPCRNEGLRAFVSYCDASSHLIPRHFHRRYLRVKLPSGLPSKEDVAASFLITATLCPATSQPPLALSPGLVGRKRSGLGNGRPQWQRAQWQRPQRRSQSRPQMAPRGADRAAPSTPHPERPADPNGQPLDYDQRVDPQLLDSHGRAPPRPLRDAPEHIH